MTQSPTPASAQMPEDDGAQVFTVDATSAGMRLDAWLAGQMPEHVSRNRVTQLIKSGQVSRGGRSISAPKHRVAENETYALIVPEAKDPEPKPEAISLDILFEDDHVIVINKPPGMVVHPAPGNASGTLVNALLHHCGDSLSGIGGVKRPGIVHRLDKDTSGVMVAAKTEAAMAGLAAQFADHGRTGPLERAYLAIVWGLPNPRKGKIDAPLGRSSKERLKRAVVPAGRPDARAAITHYTVLKPLDGDGDGMANLSLVECRLETGRTHQIRVHMAHIGHPLVGDQDYGKHYATKVNRLEGPLQTAAKALNRQALHAAVLGFAHPATGKALRFEAPVPADIEAILKAA